MTNKAGYDITLKHYRDQWYHLILTPKSEGGTWKLRGPITKRTAVHPPGGPWIGLGGKLDCLGVADTIVDDIDIHDNKVLIKVKHTTMSMTEDQLLEHLFNSPESIKSKLAAVNTELVAAHDKVNKLERRKQFYETLLNSVKGQEAPKSTRKVKQVKKVARKVAAKKVRFAGIRPIIVKILNESDQPMEMHDITEHLKQEWGITRGERYNRLRNSVTTALNEMTTGNKQLLTRTMDDRKKYKYVLNAAGKATATATA